MSLAHQAKRMNPEKIAVLKDRALMFSQARNFFADRGVIEVDCPAMSRYASVDAHIDLIKTQGASSEIHYLHSSPEYGMKKLLSQGMGDIYQISHVFRDDVKSERHAQEFTMAEWYRINMSFSKMIEETIDFIREFLGQLPYTTISYREAFQRYAGLDYAKASVEELTHHLTNLGIPLYEGIELEGKDALLDMILGIIIQPNFGNNELLVLQYFPASQALLSQTKLDGDQEVSIRFEVYYQGIELANGFLELTDPIIQNERLVQINHIRETIGKNTLPIDQFFIDALKKGLPDCSGVAVGFDRLMMLRLGKSNILDVLPISE